MNTNLYPVTQGLALVTHALTDVRNDVATLQQSVEGVQGAQARMHTQLQAQAQTQTHAQQAQVGSPVPAQPHQPSIDVQALKSTIEQGLRSSIRASLQSDIQQGVRDERQLTESSLTIRYDAMVARIVKDHVTAALSDMRLVIEETLSKTALPVPVTPVTPSPVAKKRIAPAAPSGKAGKAPAGKALSLSLSEDLCDGAAVDHGGSVVNPET